MSYEYIVDYIGNPAVLEQLAEECTDLAHAALKLSRILRDENPTPATSEEMVEVLTEEVADVLVCIDAACAGQVCSISKAQMENKRKRWESRIREHSRQQFGYPLPYLF